MVVAFNIRIYIGAISMGKIMLVCEDSYDGILTAIYNAWSYRGHQVGIITNGEYNIEMFTEYIDVATELDKSAKVSNTIRRKISEAALDMVYSVAVSNDSDKCNMILGFIMYGLSSGRDIATDYTNYYVIRCEDIRKKVWNESHFYLEILRFEELPGKILCARITPRANVMVHVMDHFSDRFPSENFLIYDENRKICGIHSRNNTYYIHNNIELDEYLDKYMESIKDSVSDNQADIYSDLWKVFFNTIAIKERTNYSLQRNNVPLLYRKHMTEFIN